jgi:pyrimidine deaminase RibD-like protein
MARRNAARSDFDLAMMRRAVALAKRGLGATYPNPSVGALVVQGERVVATGRTAPTGGPHAEARAIAKAGEDARGGTRPRAPTRSFARVWLVSSTASMM